MIEYIVIEPPLNHTEYGTVITSGGLVMYNLPLLK